MEWTIAIVVMLVGLGLGAWVSNRLDKERN
jgi:hypothetical protein